MQLRLRHRSPARVVQPLECYKDSAASGSASRALSSCPLSKIRRHAIQPQTLAFKTGCLFCHDWVHTPDCKAQHAANVIQLADACSYSTSIQEYLLHDASCMVGEPGCWLIRFHGQTHAFHSKLCLLSPQDYPGNIPVEIEGGA